MSTSTQATALPDHVEAHLPMVAEVGRAVDVLIRSITHSWGLPAYIDKLGDAGRTAADQLCEQADAWSMLGLSVERDDDDVYVRLSAEVREGVEPILRWTTPSLMSDTTGSHHVALEGRRMLIVLQAALR